MGQVCCLSCTEIDTMGQELSPLGTLFCLPKRDVMRSLHEREAGRLHPRVAARFPHSLRTSQHPAGLDPSGTLRRRRQPAFTCAAF